MRYAVFTLFLFLLIQPAAPVFAADDAPLLDETESLAIPPSLEDTAPEETLPETLLAPSTITIGEEDVAAATEEQAEAPAENTASASSSPAADASDGTDTDQDTEASSTPDTTEISETSASSSSADADTDAGAIGEHPGESAPSSTSTEPATSSQGSADASEGVHTGTDRERDQASSTSDASEEATSTDAVLIEHNSGTYAFDAKECATVGDGAFYCSTPKDVPAFTQDGVFTAPDTDGDQEIFVRVGGKATQLTRNRVDDSAPYYDALSGRIVWHRSIDDRYQIVSYDLRTQKETQLTSTSYNNMEPVAYGDLTLWQAWVGTNWEIMLFDGETVRQLTHNDVHDVSPHMRGSYIVWQTQFSDGWQVAVYDQETGHIEYVKTDGGAKVENPRFVLVYDSTDARGDVQTVGYDPDQKVSFTLQRIPTDVPEKLPEPDQTGETRALIQNKQGTRDGELDNLDALPQSTGGAGTATSSASTTPNTHTLDLSSASSAPASATASSTSLVEDVVIPPYGAPVSATGSASSTSHIADVVIPPQPATSTAEVR